MAPAAAPSRLSWRKSNGANSVASESMVPQTSIVVTKDQFLAIFASMPLLRMQSQSQSQKEASSSPPAGPPGLDALALESSELNQFPQRDPGAPIVDSPTGNYQVLLRGFPDCLMYHDVMKALMAAARLEEDMVGMDMRPGGKVLISFSSMESVRACIRNFHDPQWAATGLPINAMYVRTVNSMVEGKSGSREEAFAKGNTLSIDAPVFVPSKPLSADVPSFVPASAKNTEDRARVDSDASTSADPPSDGTSDICQSDGEAVAKQLSLLES